MAERRTTAGDLTVADYSHRVSFARAGNDSGARAQVTGVLQAIRETPVVRGATSRPGVTLTVLHPGRFGGTAEDYGPLPASHVVDVGRRWAPPREEDWTPPRVFPANVKRLRVHYFGDPFDGEVREVPVEEFRWSATISRQVPGDHLAVYIYAPIGRLKQIKGALWAGRWFLVEQYEIDDSVPRRRFDWPASAGGDFKIEDPTPDT